METRPAKSTSVRDISALSEREKEILLLLAQGMSNKEIADHLVISINTTKTHLTNIYRKIDVQSRTEATLVALEHFPSSRVSQAAESGSPPDDSDAVTGSANRGNPRLIILITIAAVILLGVFLIPRWISSLNSGNQIQISPEESSEDRWTQIARLSAGRSDAASVVISDHLYLFNGAFGETVSTVSESLSLADNATISQLADKPTPVKEAEAVHIGDKIYIIGGIQSDGKPTAEVEVYNPGEDAWETKAPLPIALSSYSALVNGENLLVSGGWDGNSATSSMYLYDIAEDAWKLIGDLPFESNNIASFVTAETLFVLDGNAPDRTYSIDLSQVFDGSSRSITSEMWKRGKGVTDTCEQCRVVQIEGFSFLLTDEFIWSFTPQFEWQPFASIPDMVPNAYSVASDSSSLYFIGGVGDDLAPSDEVIRFKALFTVSIPIISN